MSDKDSNNVENATDIFSDPVGYLAQFGIDAELIAETTVPVAA